MSLRPRLRPLTDQGECQAAGGPLDLLLALQTRRSMVPYTR